MHQRALKIEEKIFGVEHPRTHASINNLASVLEKQGRHKEAEAMYQRTQEVLR